MDCPADELFFGGAAGGGKSELLLGCALTRHKKSIIFRREFTQLTGADGLIQRSRDLLADRAKYNGWEHVWRSIPGGRMLEFGAVQREVDVVKYKGRAHDFKGFDEVTEFTESQYRFLSGWARTTDPRQRVRIIATGNPPTTAEGEWVIRYWRAWLDAQYPYPAQPGELRWYARVDNEDQERENGEPFVWKGETITPKSRTFIPALLRDNPHLSHDGRYEAVLQNLPEPLRSQLLFGDFTVGVEDDPWQVIPTEWVRLAQQRHGEAGAPDMGLSALGVDVARGGKDRTAIARVYGPYFASLLTYPGASTPDGPAAAALVLSAHEGQAVIGVDVIGVGASVYDSLNAPGFTVMAIDNAAGSDQTDRSGKLRFVNVRAASYWKLREALDPNTGDGLMLPDDRELLADLCAPRWKATPRGIVVEPKEAIQARLGRSPDKGDAVVLAHWAHLMAAPMQVWSLDW